MERLLSVIEASELLGLKVSTIRKNVCKRTMPFVKLGSRVLFKETELEKWVAKNSFSAINAWLQ